MEERASSMSSLNVDPATISEICDIAGILYSITHMEVKLFTRYYIGNILTMLRTTVKLASYFSKQPKLPEAPKLLSGEL